MEYYKYFNNIAKDLMGHVSCLWIKERLGDKAVVVTSSVQMKRSPDRESVKWTAVVTAFCEPSDLTQFQQFRVYGYMSAKDGTPRLCDIAQVGNFWEEVKKETNRVEKGE